MTMLKAPPLLKPGDKISVVAPGRKVSPLDLDNAVDVFKGWGLEVDFAQNLFSQKHSYLAGSDDERLSDFQNALNDPTVKAIVSARGGYGSTRILNSIDFSPLKKNPKWIVGFSDITAIHLMLYSLGLQSIHGIMPILFPKESSVTSIESLKSALFEGESIIHSSPNRFNQLGEASGITIGGNLSLLVDSLGTSSEPDTDNTILIVEEIDEYFYKIDRMMNQLKRAGKLKNLKGIVIGHMTDIKDSQLRFGETVEEIITNSVKGYNYPILFNFPSGHDNPNHAWFHGGYARLKIDSSGSCLTYNTTSS